MWIANPPTLGDYDECLNKPLYVFTNCDYVEMYKNDKFVEVFKPDKKDFPHLPHAPIVIDDYIGALMNGEKFSEHDRKIIKEALNTVGRTGFAHMAKEPLKGMDESDLYEVGHYVDDELVRNIDGDTALRLARIEKGEPLRFLLTVGGAGAGESQFLAMMKHLMCRASSFCSWVSMPTQVMVKPLRSAASIKRENEA